MDFGPVVGIVVAIAAVWVGLLVVFWVFRPKGVPARELVRIVPDVLRLLRSLVRDDQTPLDVRLVLIGLVAWILSPIDLIPEFIPVLGPLDDVVVAIVALRFVRRRVGVDELRGRWQGSPEGFALLDRVTGTASGGRGLPARRPEPDTFVIGPSVPVCNENSSPEAGLEGSGVLPLGGSY